MLLIQLLIIKAFVITSCLTSENVAYKLGMPIDNNVALRDKRTLDLGLFVRNLLQISAAKSPAPRARKMPQAMPTPTPMMMPQAPATVAPVALPAIFGLKTYEYRPDPSYYTDKNGYYNFNTNENFVLATAVATPAPPAMTTMAPPPPTQPPAQPQLTLKQQQQAAFINFLSTLSGFPQAPPPAAPPATMQPPPPPSLPPTTAPAQPGAILIPKRLLPYQQQLRENVIYQYSQPYDSSSESKTPEHYDNAHYNGQSQEHYYPNSEDSDGSYYYEGPVGSKQTHDDGHTYEEEDRQQQQQNLPYSQDLSNYPDNNFRISYPDDSNYYSSKDYADNS